jgi:hypothetical protein
VVVVVVVVVVVDVDVELVVVVGRVWTSYWGRVASVGELSQADIPAAPARTTASTILRFMTPPSRSDNRSS